MNGPAQSSSTTLYWSLGLNQHAINIALTPPYNTVQLTATPLNPYGTPLSDIGTVTYTPIDTNVTVTATGLVTARVATPITAVVATLRDAAQGITHTDTAYIQITATVPQLPFQRFSIQPPVGDSAKRSIDYIENTYQNYGQFPWPARIADGSGTTVCDTTGCSILVAYRSSNTAVATISNITPLSFVPAGVVQAVDTGATTLSAQTLAYGTELRDSVTFRIGYELLDHIDVIGQWPTQPSGFLAHSTEVLGIGAVVTFCDYFLQPMDVVFDQPSAADTASIEDYPYVGTNVFGPTTGTGNIPSIGGDTLIMTDIFSPTNDVVADCAARRFRQGGTYHWHSTKLFPTEMFTLVVRKEPY